VRRPDLVETTALGAAGLAGLAAGIWPTTKAFLAARQYREFTPGEPREAGWAAWNRAIRATLGWARDGA